MKISSSSPQNQKIRDNLTIECSLFKLTKKCFKICLKINEEKGKGLPVKRDVFFLDEDNPGRKDFENYFNSCMETCAHNYVNYRRYVKSKIMADLNDVQVKNQELYDNYYLD